MQSRKLGLLPLLSFLRGEGWGEAQFDCYRRIGANFAGTIRLVRWSTM
jgi:hypothetical protein